MPRIIWHRHVFAKHCRDEVRGRFDAVEDDRGAIYLIDVGARQKLRYSSRASAVCGAKRRAAAFDQDIDDGPWAEIAKARRDNRPTWTHAQVVRYFGLDKASGRKRRRRR